MKSVEFQGREGGCDPQLTLVDNAKDVRHGLAIGMFNSGECDHSYILKVALPGVRRRDISKLAIEISKTGKVVIKGCMKEASIPLGVKAQNLPSVGSFSLTYFLPGEVDPRLFSPSFGNDGILNIEVKKALKEKENQSNNN
ncbi:increased DNA methylation 2-like [Impatiens glandulifera]|uniref:increased DNA methylation 2-like n=1 Tax=Impatiens glandulifera TaxID=253017 RepID=UPI001FB0C624|nr:increased DNA methylation 2-like [Impatiens glandulifera]